MIDVEQIRYEVDNLLMKIINSLGTSKSTPTCKL
jgi:hypothetical protein